MGFTLRSGNLKPNEVRKAVDNYETNSLDDNILLNGKYVKDRKKRREYRRDLAQRKRESKDATMTKEAPKQASFVDNNERIKQATLLKLATLRLAINHVLRMRDMQKQANWGPTMGAGLGAVPAWLHGKWKQSPRFRGVVTGAAMGAGMAPQVNQLTPQGQPTVPEAPNLNQNAQGQ